MKLVGLARVARLGPLGMALAAYGVWRQLPDEDREHVRQRLRSLRKRVGSRATAAPLEPRAWSAGEV